MLGPLERGTLPPGRDRPRGRPALDGLRRLAPAVQPGRAPADLPDLQDPAVAPLERPGLRPPLGRPGLQHRGQLHHQHQLAGLQRGEHRLLLHPDGGPGGAQLHLRRHRHRRRRRPGPRAGPAQRQRDRQLLGRRGARHPLPAAAPLAPRGPRPGLAGRPPDAGRDGRGDRRSKAPSRRSPTGRWGARRRSRSWAPTAGASSTPTRPTPSRARPRCATFVQIVSIFLIPSALALTFGYIVGDVRQGWAVWAAMAILFLLGFAVALFAEQQGNPILAGAGRRPAGAGREHGGQGGALRRPALGAVRRGHHRRLVRGGEHDARQHDAHGGLRPAAEHPARRGRLRRGRGRALRDADLRRPGRLPGRADGGAHPRVPGQEDRGLRRQDGDADRPGAAPLHPRLHRPGGRPAGPPGQPDQPGRARLLGDPLRLHLRDRQQRLGLRRARRQHRLLQHHHRPGHADRALRHDRPHPGPGRLAGGEEAPAAEPGHVPHHRAPVRRAAGGHGPDRRRPDLLPRPVPGPHRGAAAAQRRPDRRGRDPDDAAADRRRRPIPDRTRRSAPAKSHRRSRPSRTR